MFLCGTVDQPQEAMPLVILAKPAGIWMYGCQSFAAGFRQETEVAGSSLSGWQNTAAGPAPTMM